MSLRIPTPIPPDEIGLCNCAGCGIDLLGERTTKRIEKIKDHLTRDMPNQFHGLPDPVAGRVKGRPYCSKCLRGVT